MKKLFQLFLGLIVFYHVAANAAFPERPITIVVPFGAGTASDIVVRLLASRLGPALKVPVIVENRPGANGIIGTVHGAKAEPDGYTLTLITGTTIAQNPWMFKELHYDPLKDLQAVANLGGFALSIVVKADSPYKNLADLFAAVRDHGGNVSYATSYGMQTVCGELVGRDAPGKVLSVPYKSSPQAILDVLSGRVTFVCAEMATGLSGLTNKTLKALAVLNPKGARYLPDAPSVQSTIPDFPTMQSWIGITAPTGIPKDRLKILSDAIYKIANDPSFADSLTSVGYESAAMDSARLSAYMRDEYKRWETLIKQAGIKPE